MMPVILTLLFCNLLGQQNTVLEVGSTNLRVASGDSCSGRVELYHRGEWGTVCGDGWDLNDAKAVCRFLDCGFAKSVEKSSSRFGKGTGTVWLSRVNCTGNEKSLAQCPKSEFGKTPDCDHEKDAGVECAGKSGITNLRLVNGSTSCSGRVEVLHNNQWRTLCDEGWDLNDAKVVCQSLGCGEALSAERGARFGQGTGQIWLNEVQCNGTESSIMNCLKSEFGIAPNCDHGKEAGVVCSAVRLVNGDGRCAGRVEIQYRGEWGSVCSDSWGLEDADVVCRELGCGAAESAPHGAVYGQGRGPIFLDDVDCTGRETALVQCPSRGWTTHNCSHRNDASVVCSLSVVSASVLVPIVASGVTAGALVILGILVTVFIVRRNKKRKKEAQEVKNTIYSTGKPAEEVKETGFYNGSPACDEQIYANTMYQESEQEDCIYQNYRY
ncbi:deleted in malignant brain tumors 1 protein-like [Acipenser ruthenus]|uniref:deleted in malignant brain tumors 1 protein-like n=1 Tax=Acipenser ruthenus TaxID=7906 RepID=UPI0027427C04|nr:deleted in malignant brain tumors 1 protein-like [Acipenser ruthenus]